MYYIGMDIQKRISTAVVIDDDEKTIAQYVDFETKDEMLDTVVKSYPPSDTVILIENLMAPI